MDKKAKTKYPIAENLAKRWSPRAFTDQVPSDDQLASLLEAARWAPSSFNEQPWRFIIGVAGKGEGHKKINESLVEFNQDWASHAPVLLMVCAKERFSHNDKENKHYMYDCGAAMSNLCTQATELGLYVHQMAGFSADKARELLNVPEGYKPITAAAIGYIGDPSQLNEKNEKSEKAERKRKDLDEISFEGEWGKNFT